MVKFVSLKFAFTFRWKYFISDKGRPSQLPHNADFNFHSFHMELVF